MFSKLKDKQKAKEDDKEDESGNVIDILTQYLAGMLGIGTCAIVFSQVCSKQFLLLVYSSTWTTPSCVAIMQGYCIYLMFMSLNGMAEAFAYGLANSTVLSKLQGMLMFNSILYVGSVVVLSTKFGIIGLIWANCLNMFVRATCSLYISLESFPQVSLQ